MSRPTPKRGTPARAVLAGGVNGRAMDAALAELSAERRLVAVSTRIARPATVPALATALELRHVASRTFGELCGVSGEAQRSGIFGMLLAYRYAVGLIGGQCDDRETADAVRKIAEEINSAVNWAIAAGMVAR